MSASPDKPDAPFPEDSGCMRVVDDQAGLMRARKRGDVAERRHVAIHGEDALGQDEFRPVISLILTQKLAEMAGVAMTVADLPHPRRLAAEMHARVIEAVGEDERLGAEHASVEKGLKRGGVGLEARRHDECRLLSFQAREFGLDRRKQVEIAGDEARGAGAHAPGFRPCDRPANQSLVEAQAKIVIAGEVDVGPALGADGPRLAAATASKNRRKPSRARFRERPGTGFRFRHDPV